MDSSDPEYDPLVGISVRDEELLGPIKVGNFLTANEYQVNDKDSTAIYKYNAYIQGRIYILMNIYVKQQSAFICVLFSPKSNFYMETEILWFIL